MADATDRRRARLGFATGDNPESIPKKIDNRRAPRRACNINAWIRVEGSFATQQCRVIDLSQTGMRLTVADAHTIRSGFILLWSKTGPGRHASIKWRRSTQIGAEFLTDADLRPNYLAQRVAANVTKLQELLRR